MKKVIVLLLVLFIAALSFWAGGRFGRGLSAGTQGEPVHPTLVEGRENAATPLSPGAVRIGPVRQQLIGVKVAALEEKPMTYTLRLYGRVVPDETKIYRVNASTDCWIRQLSDVTTGSIVRKDQILGEALAPSYYNAQLTYLIALDNVDRIRRQLGGELRHQQTDLANNQIRMSVQALQNLGITDAQTEELANTRQARPYLQVRAPAQGVVLKRNITVNQWFKAAEEFYTIGDIGKVWVYADVYEDEAMHMRPGMSVEIRHAQMGMTFSASVGEVLPLFDPLSRTLKVRIDVDNPRYELRPDMFVDVEIPLTMPPSLNVPDDAILETGTRAIAYVASGNGVFEPRKVETGRKLGGRTEIIRGLVPGEKIAISGNFLIDSESRMEIASLGPGLKLGADPVCGRTVDAEEAESSKKVATVANETFYFCSDRCKTEFEKEPGKYVRKGQTDRKGADRTGTQGRERSWAELLDPNKGSRSIERGGKESKPRATAAKPSPGKYPTTPEVVDWDGPDKEGAQPPKWEKGWGGFPGAKYLGVKQEDKENSPQPSNLSKASGEKQVGKRPRGPKGAPTPDSSDTEMRPQVQESSAPGQLQPPFEP